MNRIMHASRRRLRPRGIPVAETRDWIKDSEADRTCTRCSCSSWSTVASCLICWRLTEYGIERIKRNRSNRTAETKTKHSTQPARRRCRQMIQLTRAPIHHAFAVAGSRRRHGGPARSSSSPTTTKWMGHAHVVGCYLFVAHGPPRKRRDGP